MEMYHMKMNFTVDVSVKELNQLAEVFGEEKSVIGNAITVTIEQTVPFIPTTENIQEYERIIKENLIKEGHLIPEHVSFHSYSFLKMIDAEKEAEGEER